MLEYCCTFMQIVVCIFILAAASQASRFAELDFVSVNATSLIEPQPTIVVGCQYTLTPFIARHEQVRCQKIAATFVRSL